MSDVSPAQILYDEGGHPVGVVLDGSIYRLQVEAKLAEGHGLATEATLSAIEGHGIDASILLTDHDLLVRTVVELQRIRVLLEHLTDEKVHEHDLETRD